MNYVYCFGSCEEDALEAIKNDNVYSAYEIAEIILDNADDYYLHKDFDETLDECIGSYILQGMEFLPSDVLKKCDPVAYRCEYVDYIDILISELSNKIESMDGNTSEPFYNQDVYCYCEEDEE